MWFATPGPADRTVRTDDGQILPVPADWELLPPRDAALTRRVEVAGPIWTVQQKKGRKIFSLGVWAPADRIAAIRAELTADLAVVCKAPCSGLPKCRRIAAMTVMRLAQIRP